MTEFMTTLIVLVALAAVIILPVSIWMGDLVTRPPPDIRALLREWFPTITRPQLALASTLAIVPASSLVTSGAYRISLIEGSQVEAQLYARVEKDRPVTNPVSATAS